MSSNYTAQPKQETELRILLGFGSSGAMDPMVRAFRAQPGVEAITFFEEGADVAYNFASDTFQDILERLPHGWEPDVVVLWSPDYFPIPVGIEESPYPTLALVQDWNLGFHRVRVMMPCFDYIFTDRRGADIFRRAGHHHVESVLMFGFDPRVQRRIPGIEKMWDIGLVGNLNHEVQRERAPWLERIARLADRRRVRIVQGLQGEDYVRALNETKITFNRSIKGEMNMRAYEAPACGSLLFLEEENLEVREVYTDRAHCVLYNDQNLEDLLDYYLDHDADRDRIVEAAYQRVQDYSYECLVARWVERMRSLGIDGKKVGVHRLGAGPADLHLARATQAFRSLSPGGYQVAERELNAALVLKPSDPTILNNLGVVYAGVADAVANEQLRSQLLDRSLQFLHAAAQEFPAHVAAFANQGEVHARRGSVAGAELAFETALSILPNGSAETRDAWLVLPSQVGALEVERHRMAAELVDDADGFTETATKLYRWWLCERIGDLRLGQSDWQRARAAYEQALEGRADGSTRYTLARVLLALDQTAEAIEQLTAATREEPFLWQARADLAGVLLQSGDQVGARRVCEDALLLIRACPNYEPAAPPFRAILDQCNELPGYTASGSPARSALEDVLK